MRMRRLIFIAVGLLLVLGLLFQGLPSLGQESQGEMAPRLSGQVLLSPRTGFIPPPMDLSHLTGQRMPDSFVFQSSKGDSLPSWDWRTQGKVTPVGDQGYCGSCYAFASIGNIESKMLIDGAGTYDFSENHAKECNWYETADINGGTSCSGGNYLVVANLFSKKGTVLESCDPYVDGDIDCKSSCPYEKTLLDWRIICGNVMPSTSVLKAYIQEYGPVYTTIYAGVPGTYWGEEFGSYDGSYTLYYDGPEEPNHAVLIVGWDDSLTHAGGSGGWIVKNSWGTDWGGTCGHGTEKGYFTIAYGSASIGMYSSFMYDWQDYDNNGGIMFYDEGGWSGSWGWGEEYPTAWGLSRFIPSSNTHVTRVEFWTTDVTTDVDVYIYDDFDGTALTNLLAQKLNNSFSEAGYHSVALDLPLAVTSGDDVIAVVKFTNSNVGYPIPIDTANPSHETGRTYYNQQGPGHIWWDMGSENGYDVAIRLRTSTPVHSPYASTPPTIDGVLSPDEWGSPAITKTLTYFNAVDNQNETHDMTVYFMNNHSYLYTAIKITDDDFEHEDYPTGEDVDVIELYFDNDNDEVIEAYEDIKNFWNLRYRDWFKVGAQYRWNDDLNDDGTLDGEGVATHSDLALGDYTYEFKIPLNSDDIHDLSVSAGSTIGIKIMYREMYWDTTSGVWEWKGEDGWPTSAGRFDGSTYGKLVLSSAGTEAPSVITNDATNITTNSATLNGNLGDVGTASTVDVSFEWGPDTSYGNETTPETMTATGPFSFELTDLPPATTYHFRAKAIGEGTSYGLGKSFTTAEAGASATRTFSDVSVELEADFDVSIEASGCGVFGQVVETLPNGFSYVSCDSTDVTVTPEDNTVKFTFIGDSVTFTYIVKASTTEGVYTFSGVVKDEYNVAYPIGGDENITVGFDPMNYDADGDGAISKVEALNAVVDYFDGAITKEQALEVIALYFAS